MKKLLIAAALCFMAAFCANATNTNHNNGGFIMSTHYSQAELQAFEEYFGTVPYARLEAEAYSTTVYQQLLKTLVMRADGEYEYPEFYGGVYYDDGGHIVFQLVRGAENAETELQRRIPGGKYAVEWVDYSYARLETEQLRISETIASLEGKPLAYMTGSILDIRKNRVAVQLLVCDDDSIARFERDFYVSPMIVYAKSRPAPPTTEEIFAGSSFPAIQN